jgi:hypothetical protein
MRRAAGLAWLLLAALPTVAGALQAGDAAPRLAPRDVRGRALEVPAPGRVMLLSFASAATGAALGKLTRAIRVEHPQLEQLAFIDLSRFPAFLRSFLTGEIAKRQADAVRETQAAFARAGRPAPDQLDARTHIVPDFEAQHCAAYGAGDDAHQPRLVLIGADGRVKAIFARAPALADVEEAVAAELSGEPTP